MTQDDHRTLAAYMANAAALVVRAARGTTDRRLAAVVEVLNQYVGRWVVLEQETRAAELADAPKAGPGWPGPCPDGMTWEQWLADNNVD